MSVQIKPIEELRTIILGYSLSQVRKYNITFLQSLKSCARSLYNWIISGETDLSKFPTKQELQEKLVELVKTGKTEFTRLVQFYIGDYWRGTDVSKYPEPTKEEMRSLLWEIEEDDEEMRRLEAATEQARTILRHSTVDFEQMNLVFDYTDYMKRTCADASDTFLLRVMASGLVGGGLGASFSCLPGGTSIFVHTVRERRLCTRVHIVQTSGKAFVTPG